MSNRTELPPDATTVDVPPPRPDQDLQPVNSQRKQVRNPDGTFAKGVSGNPDGRPHAARSRLNQALDDLAAADVTAVLQKTIDMAKDGDVAASRVILRRAWAVPKGRPIEGLSLPPVNSPADGLAAMSAIAAALSAGTISTDEARDLSDVFDAYRKMHELVDIDRRIARLERQQRHAQKNQ